MSLDDLLVDLDDIGGDTFGQVLAKTPAPAPVKPVPASAKSAPALANAAPLPAVPDPILDPDPLVPEAMLDVEFTVTVELGHAAVPLRDLLALPAAYRFALDGNEGEPLSLFVNEQLIARGEALVVDGALAVKITELLPLTPVDEGGAA
jgi:flagellar motor switch protein FliN/FliY